MPLGSLEKLISLQRQGARVLLFGDPPSRQPGYQDFQTRDSLIQRLVRELASPFQPSETADLRNLLTAISPEQDVSFTGYYPFLRRLTRKLESGDQVSFIWNQDELERFFELNIRTEGVRYYWLDPENGKVYAPQKVREGRIRGYLPGGKALFLWQVSDEEFVSTDTLPSILQPPVNTQLVNERELSNWDFTLSEIQDSVFSLVETSLFDWREHAELSKVEEEGIYVHTFELGELGVNKRYLLDLGRVEGVPFIRINAQGVDTLLYSPFRLDVTEYLLPGTNILEIWLTPPSRNARVGEAKEGTFPYGTLPKIPTGLLGPVHLFELQE